MKFERILVFLLGLSMLLAACGRENPVEQGEWLAPTAKVETEMAAPTTPSCTRMTKHYMSTTADFGQSFVTFPTAREQTASFTWGMAALDDAGTLVMHADGAFWGSEDDGCSWLQIRLKAKAGGGQLATGPAPAIDGLFRVAAGSAGHAYGWEDNGRRLFRIRHAVSNSIRWEALPMRGAPQNMKGFGVDPADPLHVRTAGDAGQIFESFDGGASWAPRGVPASRSTSLGYVIAFDPNDLDHAVYGRSSEGSYVSFDGGQRWAQATGLAETAGGRVNFFNAVISPVDGYTVFAMALDLGQSAANHPSRGRHIYASRDGGLSYVPVLDHLSDGVYLSNGPVMVANTADANRMNFISSSSPVFGGTFFYDYDLSSASLKTTHNDQIPKVRVLLPSRMSPGSMHAGFDWF